MINSPLYELDLAIGEPNDVDEHERCGYVLRDLFRAILQILHSAYLLQRRSLLASRMNQ